MRRYSKKATETHAKGAKVPGVPKRRKAATKRVLTKTKKVAAKRKKAGATRR